MDTKAAVVRFGYAKFGEKFKLQTDFEKDPVNDSKILPKKVIIYYSN
jgi:hypothetical protein